MREVWGAGLGLGGALYYNRPANSVLSGGVCIRTMAERVWLGASRSSEVHALQVEVEFELEAGELSSRVDPASGRQSVGTVWHARGETLHQQATFDLYTAAGGWREAWSMKFRRKRGRGRREACLLGSLLDYSGCSANPQWPAGMERGREN